MSPALRQLALKTLHIAWMAVLLGLGVEATLLLLNLAIGHEPSALGTAVSALSRVTWSVIVCSALAHSRRQRVGSTCKLTAFGSGRRMLSMMVGAVMVGVMACR